MNPELPALGNPAELLADGVLAREAAKRTENKRLVAWIDAMAIAIPALYRIAAAGNVAAKQAAFEVDRILHKP